MDAPAWSIPYREQFGANDYIKGGVWWTLALPPDLTRMVTC